MQFMYGCTRWVILTKNYAVKIARFRPIRPFIRLFYLLKRGEAVEKLEQHDPNLIKAVLKYIGSGILANRNERRLYEKYNDKFLVPTLFTFFWLVNIQRRGEPSGEKEMHCHYLWDILKGTSTPLTEDILQPKQFCVIDGITYLADYGNKDLEGVFV